jgi:hypothetical protein
VVDETDMVLAGHARLAACKLLEMHLVPTLKVTGLSEAQKRAFVIADNKIPENAGWDRDLLVLELGELADLLPTLSLDVTVTGFEPAEIDILFADQGSPKPDPEMNSQWLPVMQSSGLGICGVSISTAFYVAMPDRGPILTG